MGEYLRYEFAFVLQETDTFIRSDLDGRMTKSYFKIRKTFLSKNKSILFCRHKKKKQTNWTHVFNLYIYIYYNISVPLSLSLSPSIASVRCTLLFYLYLYLFDNN